MSIGILAFGSLLVDPGVEILHRIEHRIEGVVTPFPIEFARKSSTRNGAPTLIPVEEGGSHVSATILVLPDELSSQDARSLLWRREVRKECSGEDYARPVNPGPNHVLVESIENLSGVDVVHYTQICSNLGDATPVLLANLAIASARSVAGRRREDGITYLLDAKLAGISTPFMPDYEAAILERTEAPTLADAWYREVSRVPLDP